MTIGERLRFLRLRNNLTQEELGKKIGVKKQTIQVDSCTVRLRVEMRFILPLSRASWC